MKDTDLEALVQRRRAQRDLRNDDIARSINTEIGTQRVTADNIQKYLTHASGIPLDVVGPLLSALGLRVVEADAITLPREQADAMSVLAQKGLERLRHELGPK
jgi:hypothetical protein